MSDRRLVLIDIEGATALQRAATPTYDEAVEKMAKAQFEAMRFLGHWDEALKSAQESWRVSARHALAALGWTEEETT